MTRTKRVYVWLTGKEFEYLMKSFKKSGLCRKAYLRHLVAGYKVKEVPTKKWVQLIHLLSGMSNNLNQLTRLSYINGEVGEWETIQRMKDEVRVAFDEVKNW